MSRKYHYEISVNGSKWEVLDTISLLIRGLFEPSDSLLDEYCVRLTDDLWYRNNDMKHEWFINGEIPYNMSNVAYVKKVKDK